MVRVLLAPCCLSCRAPLSRPLGGPICDECWRRILAITPPFCLVCGDAVAGIETRCARCVLTPPAFEMARSAGRHEGVLREIIHTFKYERCRYLARPLAALMAEAGRDVLSGADAVVPVPLHPWRGFRRGFNQADDLSRALGLPVWRVLRRTRAGTPQAQLSGQRRIVSVRGAFALRYGPFSSTILERRLQGRTVVLIDDVMTTGATLDACSRVLVSAGVRSVRALTAARAPTRRPAQWRLTPHPEAAHHR